MTPLERALSLPIWTGPTHAETLGGGITNVNFVVTDARRSAVVRIGQDIPVHQVMRFNELAASRAAHAAGISPEVLYHEPGALVIAFIKARTLSAKDIRAPGMLERIVPLIARAHRDIPRHLRGPALVFWVFHILRDYAATLTESESRHTAALPALLARADQLAVAVGPVDLIYGHNDLLPANFLDDGARLWLIDWDYAGFNSPLFDLGGLAANNALSPEQEAQMLTAYFDRLPDAALWRRYRAMKAASALRETLWSMVSEIHSEIDFDFVHYTQTNLAAFEAAWDDYLQS